MNAQNFTQILAQARQGKPQAFNNFFKSLYAECKQQLWRYTQSTLEAEEVIAETMLAFWELFVEEGRPLPENVEGYFYTMCVNTCHRMRRERRKVVFDPVSQAKLETSEALHVFVDVASQAEFETSKTDDVVSQAELETNNFRKTVAFNNALDQLCAKCRKLFDTILVEGVRMKAVWRDLGYKNYQAIVNDKIRCTKKLKRILFLDLDL